MPSRRSAGLLAVLALGVYLWRTGPPVWSFLSGNPGDFGYNFEAAAALLRGESPYQHGYDYPPLVPLLVTPLVPLGLDGARVAWYLLGQACLLGAAAALLRPAGGDAAALTAVAAVWALGGTFAENLGLGQINPLLLLLIALVLRTAAARPTRAAALIGGAAALKIWPGLLLAPWLRPARRRGLALGIGIVALSVLLSWLVLLALVPPPRLPGGGTAYWMGTPALLNFSLPAAALRGTYRWDGEGPVPGDWESGTHHGALRLAPWRRRLSAAVALATLVAGLATLGLRTSWTAAKGTRSPRDETLALAFLAGLAVVASPISWYHYQLFLLPGGVLLAAALLRRRAWGRLAALAVALLAAGWAHRGTGAGLALEIEVPRFLVGAGLAVPLLDTAVLVLLLAEIGRAPAAVAAAPQAAGENANGAGERAARA
jgi:alpha-1,2-mannosyltransferase